MKSFAETFLELEKEDIKILKSIESGMRSHAWVPLVDIVHQTGLPVNTVDNRIGALLQLKLIFRNIIPYEGYQIGFDGYDLIALSDLVNREIVLSLGELVGVGKESAIYEALGNGTLAIKFHREGITSFRHVRRVREHLKDLPRYHWIYAARLAAKGEYATLKRLYPSVSVPKPIALNRHAVVMELLGGIELYKADVINPDECLEIILDEVRSAFLLGTIHADLSEYNILVDEEDGVRIIDWPQAVTLDHPEAIDLLKRDLRNILKHFHRKYGVDLKLSEALAHITEEEPEEGHEVKVI